MARLLVLYNQPADTAAFDRYYFATHVPLAKKIPGLLTYVVSAGKPNVVAGGEKPYLVAELQFGSMASLQTGMESAEGQAAAADLANFAQTGAIVLTYEMESV